MSEGRNSTEGAGAHVRCCRPWHSPHRACVWSWLNC